jgi:copper homeostasis protein
MLLSQVPPANEDASGSLDSLMQNGIVVEICVESAEFAMAAERAGAHRIELCSNLAVGGVTPALDLMRALRERIRLPICVMVRPRPGNFCYKNHEFELMRGQINAAKELGMDGVVLGVLGPNHTVDIDRTRELVALAHPLPVTFHRAFDECGDLSQALEDVVRTGARRILTSGGREGVVQSLARVAQLVQKAGRRVVIMPGGGVNERNAARVLRQTSANEIHSSLGGPNSPSNPGTVEKFERRVRNLVEMSEACGKETTLS